MGRQFNWDTDEEHGWDAEVAPGPSHRSRDRRLWSLVFPVGLIATGFALAYALLSDRVADREARVEADVLAVHRTLAYAVSAGDLELFSELLSREDSDWFTTQRRLFLADRVFDRGSLALAPTGAERAVDFDVSPDWREAEITLEQAYIPEGVTGPGREVSLRRTLVYAADGSAWEQVSPGEPYWGRQQTLRSERLSVEFPSRDGDLVRRLAADLETDLIALCRSAPEVAPESAGPCNDPPRTVSLRFETDPNTLVELPEVTRPHLDGPAFILPAPSLVGIPVDNAGYRALYAGYTRRILDTVRQNLALPIPLPEEKLASLCFGQRRALPELVSYDPLADEWLLGDPDPDYRSLWPLPTRTGLVLRAGRPGIDQDRLRLSMERGQGATPLIDVGGTTTTARLAAIAPETAGESLIIRFVDRVNGQATYGILSPGRCLSGGMCDPDTLAGFPVWSPDGTRTLLSRGSEILLGGKRGEAANVVSKGFSPFWLSSSIFGYIALPAGGAAGDAKMEIRLRSLEGGDVLLTDSRALPSLVDGADTAEMRLRYLAASPADPRLVFVAGSPAGGNGERYLVFSFRVEGDLSAPDSLRVREPRLRLGLNDAPVGDPSVLTPTGHPPFSITGDGRWLVVARFVDPYTNTWELDLHNIASGETETLATNYPPYPERFPFYDWSSDWKWLALIDNGFIRLIAPGLDYERVVTHPFAACSYSGWVRQ